MSDRARASAFALAGAGVLLVAMTFWIVLSHGFVNWDDDVYVYKNTAVLGSEPLTWKRALLTPELGYPAPVTMLTYRLEHATVGLEPAVFHATNLLLHTLNALLVLALAFAAGLGTLGSAGALVLFAVHPVTAEPVSWVTGRKDLLAAFFLFIALLQANQALGPRSNHRSVFWALFFFALAALSKPVAIVFPLLVLAWAMIRGQRGASKQAVELVIPALILSCLLFVLSYVGQQKVNAIGDVDGPTGALREAWYALGHHLALLVGVETPCPKYIPIRMPPPFTPAIDLLPIAFAASAFFARRSLDAVRAHTFDLGLLFAAITYLPSSNLIPLRRFLADSYLYLPLAGLGIAFGACLERLHERLAGREVVRIVVPLSLVAFALVLATAAREASTPWQDGVALWSKVRERFPYSPQVCRNFGNALNEARQPEAALQTYEACAAAAPMLFEKNIAVTLYYLGRYDEALERFRALARTQPDEPVVRRYLELLERR